MRIFHNTYLERLQNSEVYYKTSFIDQKDGKKKNTNCYTAWVAMRVRVLNEANKLSLKSYEECFVNEHWFDFQHFADFFYGDKFRKDGWHLDKDLLIRGNKEYGPETCCFLPAELNQLIKSGGFSKTGLPSGVYKRQEREAFWYEVNCRTDKSLSGHVGIFKTLEEASNAYIQHKEKWVRACADKYEGVIDSKALEALRNWTYNSTIEEE